MSMRRQQTARVGAYRGVEGYPGPCSQRSGTALPSAPVWMERDADLPVAADLLPALAVHDPEAVVLASSRVLAYHTRAGGGGSSVLPVPLAWWMRPRARQWPRTPLVPPCDWRRAPLPSGFFMLLW